MSIEIEVSQYAAKEFGDGLYALTSSSSIMELDRYADAPSNVAEATIANNNE